MKLILGVGAAGSWRQWPLLLLVSLVLPAAAFGPNAVQTAPVVVQSSAGFKAQLRSSLIAQANPRINVGGTFQQDWQATCYDINGQPVADTVTFSVSGAPSTGGATAAFSPNPVATFVITKLTVTTTKTTSPGNYNMIVSGTGPVCGSYGTGSSPLDVAPLLDGGDAIWWFNGQTPGGYKVKTAMKSKPAGIGSYLWTITAGADKATFSNNSSTITTTAETTPIKSKGPNGSTVKNDVSVTVTVNGVASDPLMLTVLVPNSLKPLLIDDSPATANGYRSLLHYSILDQFGDVLPSLVPLNEQFTTAAVKDYPGTNWPQGVNKPATVNPADWTDNVSAVGAGGIPPPTPPQTPLGNVKVEHWSGQWQIGSLTIGAGRRVQTNVWQLFQDHGRHRNIVSPAP
jgi:hypothetical protein